MKKTLEELVEAIAIKQEEQHQESDRRLDNIEKVMIAQEINLKEHMRRSDNLETIVKNIQDNELKPVQRHVNMVEGAFKLLGVMALLVSIATGIAKLFSLI